MIENRGQIPMNKLTDYRLILASKSPRRRELILGLDLCVEIAPEYHVDESFSSEIPLNKVAGHLSEKKSIEYPFELKDKDILITSDTVVLLGDTLMGKPNSKEEAFNMLKKLSGKTHNVITGVTLRGINSMFTFDETTKVTFAELSDEDINYYIDRYEPYDKAGSYGIQEWIGYVAIERIEGSFYNVMGLPVCRLCKELKTIFINQI